jgi:DNA transformation protein and related proteins
MTTARDAGDCKKSTAERDTQIFSPFWITRGSVRSDSFKEFITDQLRDVGGVNCRAMFGGYGLYRDGAFFGIIHKGRLFFKTDAATAEEYAQRAMKSFRPNAKQILKTYYEVPVDIIEDADCLTEWAVKAIKVSKALSERERRRDSFPRSRDRNRHTAQPRYRRDRADRGSG